ncbi:pseudouridine synthase [Chitinophaga rhizophila]|uniref:Pseudouridine synthase n=1 Tax=Chitinophaga rhizophila TaxID=2866212 RepID=A0ABS7GGV5_9BACT|nr:pseudouridine synthase [Chitinophaga rhizophila]MBW8686551.1 pseudouridine synthase [Chitinophaga rhizophila]
MRKNTPAKKGFSPFKENKNSSSNKGGQRSGGTDRKRNDDDSKGRGDSSKGDRPFRSESPRGERPFRSESPRGERPSRSESPRGERPSRSESPRGERPFRSERKEKDNEATGRGKFERSERPFRTERKDQGEETPRSRKFAKPGGSEKATPKPTERDENGRRRRIEPVRKTASGRTPFKPKPQQADDSAFHGAGEKKSFKRGNKDERSTPSGFNRKKFFDSANERFAGKQDRKLAARKARHEDDNFGKKFSKKEDSNSVPGEMPLNKFIAHSGLCSRRKAVDFVKEGKVTVNGTLVTEPAFKVTAKDEVAINNRRISIQKNLVYILLNKPKGYITTTDDPEGRKTVMELIQDATTEEQRVYPVGRLDRNTSGLLLLTNDGELAQKLAHPKHNIKKIYHVGLNKPLTKADFENILQGVTLEDGVAHVDALGYVEAGDKTQVGIEIHSGKNRIVRRIFEHLEYEVEKLDRVTYAGLTKKNINRGKWRFLTEKEIILLKHFK